MLGCLEFGYAIYDRLGLEIKVELSTRPENKLGTDEEWDVAEAALAQALERRGLEYTINEGDGAFYGPKIDLHMLDSLGRSWQIGTVQLDFQMPQRFGLRYQGADNAEHTPVMIHRALIGSFERFIGILIEHFAGAFPFWLAPGAGARSSRSGSSHREAGARARRAARARYRVEVDDSRRDGRQADPQRRAREDPVRGRLRRQGVRRRRSRSASTAAGSRRSRLRSCAQLPCYADALTSRGETVSHLQASRLRRPPVSEVQPNGLRTVLAAACQRLFHFRRRTTRAW